MNSAVEVISAGAAKGLFNGGGAALAAIAGGPLNGVFGAVGAMQDLLVGGRPCDLVVLTRPMLDKLAADGVVSGATIRSLGLVRTGVAVREGEPWPDVSAPARLQANLLACNGLWVPDTQRSTAGRHVAAMLAAMGIGAALANRLHAFDNGALAMADLARSGVELSLGITQVTEILYTPGVRLVGTLPAPYELSTEYAVAATTAARAPAVARACIDWLCDSRSAALREAGGFEPPG